MPHLEYDPSEKCYAWKGCFEKWEMPNEEKLEEQFLNP